MVSGVFVAFEFPADPQKKLVLGFRDKPDDEMEDGKEADCNEEHRAENPVQIAKQDRAHEFRSRVFGNRALPEILDVTKGEACGVGCSPCKHNDENGERDDRVPTFLLHLRDECCCVVIHLVNATPQARPSCPP